MSVAKNGDTVKVHYTGKLKDNEVFDSSEGKEPLQFIIGSGMVIEGFDKGVEGMAVGEKRTIEIPSEKAYGPFRDDMVIEFGIDQFPEGTQPKVGEKLELTNDQSHRILVTIKEIKGDKVFLDANPPLAGQDLIFDLELTEIIVP